MTLRARTHTSWINSFYKCYEVVHCIFADQTMLPLCNTHVVKLALIMSNLKVPAPSLWYLVPTVPLPSTSRMPSPQLSTCYLMDPLPSKSMVPTPQKGLSSPTTVYQSQHVFTYYCNFSDDPKGHLCYVSGPSGAGTVQLLKQHWYETVDQGHQTFRWQALWGLFKRIVTFS